MGNQLCCQERQARELTFSVPQDAVTSQRANLNQISSYSLSPQAEGTYNSLKQKYGNDEFLSIKSQMTLNPSLKYRQSFQKLPKLSVIYSGQWNKDLPEGRGKIIFSNGSLLIGIFKNNACNDTQCHFIFKDGSHYEGSIANNTLSGRGKLVNAKITYEGHWADGKPHGEGMEIYQNGDKFIGSFKNGKKEGNNCTFRWDNHEKFLLYSGEFKENKIAGKGKLTFKNGTVIEGFFDEESIMNANCTNVKFSCSCSFVKGLLQGKGILKLNRNQYQGQFKNGQLYGKCVHIDSKSRRNDIFAFKGRELKEVKGLEDNQIQHILEIIDNIHTNGQSYSDTLKKINHTFNKEYEAKLIEPFETIFNDRKYLIIQNDESTIYVKSKKL